LRSKKPKFDRKFSPEKRDGDSSSERECFTSYAIEEHKGILKHTKNHAIYIDTGYVHGFDRKFLAMTSTSYHYRQTHVISSQKRTKYKNYDGFRRDENSVREIERVATKIRLVTSTNVTNRSLPSNQPIKYWPVYPYSTST